MSSSNSHSIHQNSQQQPQIEQIPQIQKANYSDISNSRQKLNVQYTKVQRKQQMIDEQAILKEFHKKSSYQDKLLKNLPRKIKIVKPSKVAQIPSKKFDFGNIKKKWKAEIDIIIENYKFYLNQQKKSYDSKRKNNLLDLFKVLIDGVYELKDYAQQNINDLTNNQKKIISKQSDAGKWILSVVDAFDTQLKAAQMNGKIQSSKQKWDSLIKNCRDLTNFQLRRKIIRSKVKPIHVIQNNDEYLKSEETKLKEEKIKKRILAQASIDFQNPRVEDTPQVEQQQQVEILDPPQILRNISSEENLDRKLSQQREKIEQYKQLASQQFVKKIKQRIIEDLEGTQSYERIMKDFELKFPGV